MTEDDDRSVEMPEAIFTRKDLDFAKGLARSHPLAPEMDCTAAAESALPLLREARQLFAEGVIDVPQAINDMSCRGNDVRITMTLGMMTEPQRIMAFDMVRMAVARWRTAESN